jgi:serine/threonine protein kinase
MLMTQLGAFNSIYYVLGLKISAQTEPLDDILRIYNVYMPELSTFLNSMLQILPDDRLSAKSLLASDWLQQHDD